MDLSQILQNRGLISVEQAEAATRAQPRQRADQWLVEQGLLTEEAALRALGEELDLPYIELPKETIDPTILALFPAREIFRHTLLPFQRKNGGILVATADPFDLEALDELAAASGERLIPVLARRGEIARLIRDRLGVGGDTIGEMVARRNDSGVEWLDTPDADAAELDEQAQAASVVRLVNELLLEALNQHASDVHLEPEERGLLIRFRVDGMLRVQPAPPEINQFQQAIVSRLKIMSRLNIAEKRLPQDGRIKLRITGRDIDVRVSIIPMLHGEGVVMRLLDKGRMAFDLKGVGMPAEIAKGFYELIALPHGIVLVTGPTGSGKTTTLYSALSEIKGPELKIITVEDPVEYHLDGISQIQVHSKIGLTFAAGLRSILRHDPDVILIGEIRDAETATSAIQASLTGHLVFSTLHTNDASGAFTRLVDMGVEPYLVSSSVEGVLAQRLVRVFCKHCKEKYTPDPSEWPDDFPVDRPDHLYRAVGCRECRGIGFSGRMGIYELLRTDDHVRHLCAQRASAIDIRKHALAHGTRTLRQDGWEKVSRGLTSIEEVLRITKGDAF